MKKTKYILVYDVASIPDNSSMDSVLKAFVRDKVVLYDSTKGEKPVVTTSYEEIKPRANTSSYIDPSKLPRN